MSGFSAGWDPERPGAVAGPGETVFSEALAAEIVGAVAAGGSLRGFCAQPGRPHRTTVRLWARAYPDFGAALAAAYARARAAVRRRDEVAEAARKLALAQAAAMRAAAGRKKGGRASGYTKALGEAICERLEAGESLTAIAADPKMPSYGVMLRWAKRFPGFGARYAQARQVQGDYLFDEARDVAKAATAGDVSAARLRFDVIRWQSARLAPRKYLEPLVAAAGKAEVAAAAQAGGARGDDEPVRVRFFVTRFEAGPNGKVLAAPPRNAREAQAWIDAYGKPYEEGVGPKGEVRPPATTPEDWAARDALNERLARQQRR